MNKSIITSTVVSVILLLNCSKTNITNPNEDYKPIALSLKITNVSEHGGFDGSIDLMVYDGQPPYQYLWSNGVTSEDIDNLTAGRYSVNVRDSKGESASISATVNEPEEINVGVEFEQYIIDLDFQGMHKVQIIDFDNDGDLDIVGGSEFTPYTVICKGIAWWRNDGGDPVEWTRFEIDYGFEHVMSIDVEDINGDSYLDVVATSWSLNQIKWWRNSGDPTGNWNGDIINSNFINAHDAKAHDINSDGYVDIIGVSSAGEVSIYYNTNSDVNRWDRNELTTSFNDGKSLIIEDIDYDGDMDILGSAAAPYQIVWWENAGGDPINWELSIIEENYSRIGGIDLVDINEDGLYDIIGTSYTSNEVAYWICEDLNTNIWNRTVISNQLEGAVQGIGGDIDNDNDIDIVAVGKTPGELAYFINTNLSWEKHILKGDFTGGTALSVIDLDNDSDFDIVAGASGLGRLYWWKNLTIN